MSNTLTERESENREESPRQCDFFAVNRSRFSSLQKIEVYDTGRTEGLESEEFIKMVLELLHEEAPKNQPLSKDLVCLRNAIAAIYETKSEKVLDENEAMAVIKFVVARFIEKRFARTFHAMLPSDRTKWFVRSYKKISQ